MQKCELSKEGEIRGAIILYNVIHEVNCIGFDNIHKFTYIDQN